MYETSVWIISGGGAGFMGMRAHNECSTYCGGELFISEGLITFFVGGAKKQKNENNKNIFFCQTVDFPPPHNVRRGDTIQVRLSSILSFTAEVNSSVVTSWQPDAGHRGGGLSKQFYGFISAWALCCLLCVYLTPYAMY